MLHKNRLFTPGPTPLLPAAQTAMASFTAHHRTADFKALFQRVLADMKEFIGTKNDVLVLACSGTGVMEASVSNLTSPGEVRFETDASITPVPEHASTNTSFLVPMNSFMSASTR